MYIKMWVGAFIPGQLLHLTQTLSAFACRCNWCRMAEGVQILHREPRINVAVGQTTASHHTSKHMLTFNVMNPDEGHSESEWSIHFLSCEIWSQMGKAACMDFLEE